MPPASLRHVRRLGNCPFQLTVNTFYGRFTVDDHCVYCRARELLKDDGATVRQAVDLAIGDVTEKHSLEYRFAVRWNHSVKTCLAMRQNYRSSDVYS